MPDEYWRGLEQKNVPDFFKGQGLIRERDILTNGKTEVLRVVDVGSAGKGLVAKVKIDADTRVFGFHGLESEILQEREARLATLPDENSTWFNLDGNPDHYLPNAVCVGQEKSPKGLVNIHMNPVLDSPLRFLNHSCDPNTTRLGEFTAWSLRDIKPGEEITMDYSLLDVNPKWHMKCECGSPNCRGEIRSVQFLTPEQIKVYWRKLPDFMKRIYLKTANEKYKDPENKRLLEELEKLWT